MDGYTLLRVIAGFCLIIVSIAQAKHYDKHNKWDTYYEYNIYCNNNHCDTIPCDTIAKRHPLKHKLL